jgi:UDP-N-acetylglucosamine transferase subunit ALG13
LIFVTLGTHTQPFPRALALVQPLAAREEIVVQHGHTAPPSWCVPSRCFDFIDYDRLVTLVQAAEAVVCHGGVGTIMTALGFGKIPIVIPRLARFGEHVDDHQVDIATAFAERGLVVWCENGDLEPALQAACGRAALAFSRAGELRRAVAEAVRAP